MENNNIGEKFLPIGTVCMLKNATKRVMITGFITKTEKTEKVYDYCGCLYPEGMLSSTQNLLFNHDQIEKVFFKGYVDNEQELFQIRLKELVKELDKKVEEIN